MRGEEKEGRRKKKGGRRKAEEERRKKKGGRMKIEERKLKKELKHLVVLDHSNFLSFLSMHFLPSSIFILQSFPYVSVPAI
jgi:hypothetical protein